MHVRSMYVQITDYYMLASKLLSAVKWRKVQPIMGVRTSQQSSGILAHDLPPVLPSRITTKEPIVVWLLFLLDKALETVS